jgi:predicted DNA-binding protein
MMNSHRYNVVLPAQLNRDLETVSENLGATKAEVLRRALLLFKHAAEADEVKLVKGTEETKVIIK